MTISWSLLSAKEFENVHPYTHTPTGRLKDSTAVTGVPGAGCGIESHGPGL
jgi:hypothetical protein